MDNKLIILKQLPIIEENLNKLSEEVKKKVNDANKLVVNEETYKEVKKTRAELTKEFNELETQRKTIKKAILEPYENFESIYLEKIGNLYKNADISLKQKINYVEEQLKLEKQQELEMFAKEWFCSKGIEKYVTFEDIGLNITMTASIKSLKEQVISFCERIFNDIKLLSSLPDAPDLIYAYTHNGFELNGALSEVKERKQQLEIIEKQQEKQEEQQEIDNQIEKKVEEIIAPVEIEEEITLSFTVTSTKTKLRELRDFMKERGIKYE